MTYFPKAQRFSPSKSNNVSKREKSKNNSKKEVIDDVYLKMKKYMQQKICTIRRENSTKHEYLGKHNFEFEKCFDEAFFDRKHANYSLEKGLICRNSPTYAKLGPGTYKSRNPGMDLVRKSYNIMSFKLPEPKPKRSRSHDQPQNIEEQRTQSSLFGLSGSYSFLLRNHSDFDEVQLHGSVNPTEIYELDLLQKGLKRNRDIDSSKGNLERLRLLIEQSRASKN